MYGSRGLAVVDEHGDLHRLVGRRDAQHLARDVVLADDEVGGAEAGDRRARLVERR